MNLREDLLAHERAASAVYEQEKGIKPANNRFGYYTYLRTAADLADYVSKAFTTKNSKERETFYISKGFRSYDAILNEHRDEISHSKKTSIRDIKPGDHVTAYDICVISNTYDLMHGMTVNKEDPIHPFVCLRSEIGGVYSDNITEDDRFYNYSLEKETQANFESASFSKPVNRLLYDDFLRQDILSQAMQIPAHLFVRYSNRSDYVYRGVYFVNSLIDGNKMFELIRESFVINPLGVMSGDKQMLEEFKKDRRAFFQKLYSKSADTFAHDHRLREVRDLPPEFFDVLPDGFRPISGDNLEQVLRDYLEEAAIRQQIGSLGEELVREYEEERVKLFAPQQVRNIRKAADSEGFDFESFESRGRIIRKVQIEVKTTSDRNPLRRFFMSSNEVKIMNENPESYWLYRVFDINAEDPQFFALRENVKGRINMQPADFACQILG